MYNKFRIRLKIRDKILGGIPKAESSTKWLLDSLNMSDIEEAEQQIIRTRLTKVVVDAQDDIDALESEIQAAIAEQKKKIATGFRSNEQGIYIGGHMIKALLRDSCEGLGMSGKKGGIANYKQYFKKALIVKPDEIPLGVKQANGDGQIGEEITMGHVIGMQGPRSIIRFNDFVSKPVINFEIWVPAFGSKITLKKLTALLEHGGEIGLGSGRSLNYGKYDVELVEQFEGGGDSEEEEDTNESVESTPEAQDPPKKRPGRPPKKAV